MVVCEGIKGEGKCLFPSPFKSFVSCKYLVLSALRVKAVLFRVGFSHVLMEESKGRRKWRKGEGEGRFAVLSSP